MNYQIKTTKLDQFPTLRKNAKSDQPQQFYLGLDAELHGCAVSISLNGETPRYEGKRSRQDILNAVKAVTELGHSVALCQEACGFGYDFHRQLEAAGAQSIVVAPEPLNGKRKTDKADSRKLTIDLVAFLHLNNQKALRPIRVPSLSEEQTRALHRGRHQLVSVRNQLVGQARSLAVQFNRHDIPKGWWGKRKWIKFSAQLKAAGELWLLQQLEAKLSLIRQIQDQIDELERVIFNDAALAERQDMAESGSDKVPARADDPGRRAGEVRLSAKERAGFEGRFRVTQPKGLGIATRLEFRAELCDPGRFKNRKQVGSFVGMCPGEYSSGKSQRLGAIDRCGNPALRCLLVEAAWRMVRYQPGWRGLKQFGAILHKDSKASKTARRKSIVAVARLLAVDLWRLETGRCTLEELGFTPTI